MILIQLLLVAGLAFLLLRFLANSGSYHMKAWAKIFGVLFVASAVYVVLFPDSSNTVAQWFGVGRGADLLLYLLTLSFISVVLHSYVTDRRESRRMVVLARKVAILEAELRQKQGR
jgi:hypothetical protein